MQTISGDRASSHDTLCVVDRSSGVIAAFVASGVGLLVLIWAGWHAVVRPPVKDCTVGEFAAGRYEIELVATDGPKSGAKSSGTMTLRCATPDDTSLDGERVPDPGCDGPVGFYGFTDLDFKALAAPVEDHPPLPTSEDPVWPGIVGWVHREENAVIGFLIGTVNNRRDDGCHWLDGAGIFLRVYGAEPRFRAWTWKPWGIVRGGSGSFMMRYVGPE